MSIEQGIPKSHNPHQIAVLGDLMTEVRDEVVAGSNPVIPTIQRPHNSAVFLMFQVIMRSKYSTNFSHLVGFWWALNNLMSFLCMFVNYQFL